MNQLQSMKNPIGKNKMFQILFEVAQIVLLIPHSNAAIECLFPCKQQLAYIHGKLSSVIFHYLPFQLRTSQYSISSYS